MIYDSQGKKGLYCYFQAFFYDFCKTKADRKIAEANTKDWWFMILPSGLPYKTLPTLTLKEVEYRIECIKTTLRNAKVDCDFKVYPCARRYKNKDYHTGNVCTVFTWHGDNSIKSATPKQKKYYSVEPDKVMSYYNKYIKPELKRVDSYIRLLSVYRESGLVPKKVAVRHKRLIEDKYGKMWRMCEDSLNYANRLCGRYVEKWATCPHCKEKGFQETILGWSCTSCGATWEDTKPRMAKWSGVMSIAPKEPKVVTPKPKPVASTKFQSSDFSL